VFKMSMLKAFENIPIVIRKEGMMWGQFSAFSVQFKIHLLSIQLYNVHLKNMTWFKLKSHPYSTNQNLRRFIDDPSRVEHLNTLTCMPWHNTESNLHILPF
jgi:hypothetical protein